MLVKVHFHKALQSKTEGVKEKIYEVEDLMTLYHGITNNFPELAKHFNAEAQGRVMDTTVFLKKDKTVVRESELRRDKVPEGLDELWLIPSIVGAFVVGVAVSVAIQAAIQASIQATIQAIIQAIIRAIINAIIQAIISAIISALTPKRKQQGGGPAGVPDTPTRQDNNIFSGLQNTVSVDTPIYLIYGNHRTGGHLISGRIKVINHGKTDFIDLVDFL